MILMLVELGWPTVFLLARVLWGSLFLTEEC
jgi:hypothetical protein